MPAFPDGLNKLTVGTILTATTTTPSLPRAGGGDLFYIGGRLARIADKRSEVPWVEHQFSM